ncbi:TPA: DUF1836 domain-containing protein [Streptococcus equi subsp. zooepidemicus]|uniref:DUF1836 domain-containing protein n=1 Tax=Streptococcus equi TaxID=1336 RepID=UPI001E3B70DC|nr:DUF1836 domain-containing protein [Streptococcus equi]MCD3372828.1 DUF1836 domain-containing protein [Streptococcus equi subsp. zooepidemicus]HEL0578571.1 DUF1836 domain-containing protein [Streptococcus equi subsp. zooepidemicus]HEL0795075.1 DUF1836 domain-containing protein [Streptococcus equi subsp. zooepidemicus]
MEYDTLPSWKDLPDLELYLDQVLLYVNQVTQLSQATDHKLLTASMINNYVKHGYIDKPIKKKYQKKQVARLIAISILKNVFPIQDISQVLTNLQAASSSEVLYDTFVNYWNNGLTQSTPEIISYACQTVKDYQHTMKLSREMEDTKHEPNL